MKDFNILEQSEKFRYQLLSRMKQDCEYYLSYGRRNKKYLWALDEKEQIETMKQLYNSFDSDKKPKWLTSGEIEQYKKEMIK